MSAPAMDRTTRSNVVRLATAQALAGANAAVIFATGAIIGATLAPNPAWATVPISIFVVGTALGTLPNGMIGRRYGRRAAFMSGGTCGAIAGLIGAVALWIGSFPLYCVATLCAGLYASVVQSFRFAAADGVEPSMRPRALSWVMAGGVFAGVIGPQLVTYTMDLTPGRMFAASYLAQAAVAVIAMLVLSGVQLPRPAANAARGRPLGVIVRQRSFIVAALCGVVSYSLMNLVMTSAPLAMKLCGLPIVSSNTALQWHVVAMYGPSFFTGSLIARFGAPRVVTAGLVLLTGAAVVGLSGVTVPHFMLGLILLGLGWNFGFVGASAMVLECHRPEERTRVQSFNDFLVFGTMAVGSFSSGQLLQVWGWAAVNWVVFPPVILVAGVLLFSGRLRLRNPALQVSPGD